MMILEGFCFQRIQALALEHLAALHFGSGDIRFVVAALAMRLLSTLWTLVRAQLCRRFATVLAASGNQARAADIADADTTVSAGVR